MEEVSSGWTVFDIISRLHSTHFTQRVSSHYVYTLILLAHCQGGLTAGVPCCVTVSLSVTRMLREGEFQGMCGECEECWGLSRTAGCPFMSQILCVNQEGGKNRWIHNDRKEVDKTLQGCLRGHVVWQQAFGYITDIFSVFVPHFWLLHTETREPSHTRAVQTRCTCLECDQVKC